MKASKHRVAVNPRRSIAGSEFAWNQNETVFRPNLKDPEIGWISALPAEGVP